ncbi:MAG: hypothetical protein ACTSXQ_06610 [Alphaproteobacteria bacterium]
MKQGRIKNMKSFLSIFMLLLFLCACSSPLLIHPKEDTLAFGRLGIFVIDAKNSRVINITDDCDFHLRTEGSDNKRIFHDKKKSGLFVFKTPLGLTEVGSIQCSKRHRYKMNFFPDLTLKITETHAKNYFGDVILLVKMGKPPVSTVYTLFYDKQEEALSLLDELRPETKEMPLKKSLLQKKKENYKKGKKELEFFPLEMSPLKAEWKKNGFIKIWKR